MVSIIIINYRQKDFVVNCVESIQRVIRSPYEIIIVNNSPTEELNLSNKCKVIPNVNRGFSQANNLASQQAKGEYLLFLNADTIVRNDFLTNAVESMEELNVGAMGMRMLNEDKTFQLSFWKENTFSNEKLNKQSEVNFKKRDKEYINKIEKEHSKITEADWVSGAALMIKKSVFQIIGGFDEDYFLFYEDADLCKRLKDLGYKIYYCPYSYIIHFKGENVNEEFLGKTYFYAKQSQLIYYKKHNSMTDNVSLRAYLLVKFGFKYITSFRSINLKIVLLVLGLRSRP